MASASAQRCSAFAAGGCFLASKETVENMRNFLLGLAGLLVGALVLAAQGSTGAVLAAADARSHVGEAATVCGQVADVRAPAADSEEPTLLDFEKPHPFQTFAAVIPAPVRERFGRSVQQYREKFVCVAGKIQSHQGEPRITVERSDQLVGPFSDAPSLPAGSVLIRGQLSAEGVECQALQGDNGVLYTFVMSLGRQGFATGDKVAVIAVPHRGPSFCMQGRTIRVVAIAKLRDGRAD